jgi:acyl carrier protein
MSLNASPLLRDEIKALVVEALMLSTPAADLSETQPLFGTGGLGLDSVDALQLVVALDKGYGLKIADAEVAKQVLASIASIAEAVAAHQADAAGQQS